MSKKQFRCTHVSTYYVLRIANTPIISLKLHIFLIKISLFLLHRNRKCSELKTNNREGSKSMSEHMESTIAGAAASAVCPWEDAPTAVSVSVCPWDDEDPPSTSKQTARQYSPTLQPIDSIPIKFSTFFIRKQIEK